MKSPGKIGSRELSHKGIRKTLPLVCRQFAALLRIELPLVQVVGIVASRTTNRVLARIWQCAYEDMLNGESLAESLSDREERLPDTFLEAIRRGEDSDDLRGAFLRMADYYDSMNHIRAKALNAMIYPAFVLGVAVMVVGIILSYTVPSYTSTFAAMNIELPWITVALTKLENFGQKYGGWILLFLAAMGLGLFVYARTEKGRVRFGRLYCSVPIVGRISGMAAASQFARTLSTLLASGTPYTRAIELSGRAIGNAYIRGTVLEMLPDVEAGMSLGECLHRMGKFPELLTEMVSIGESEGTLEDFLEMMADYYDYELGITVTRLFSLLEPIMLLLLAGIVLMILLSVYIPLFELYEAI